MTYFKLKFKPPSFIYFYIEIFFVIYNMSNFLQKECILFLDSYAKICMNFGIFMHKVLLIKRSSSKFYFMNIFLDVCIKIVKKFKSVQSRFV